MFANQNVATNFIQISSNQYCRFKVCMVKNCCKHRCSCSLPMRTRNCNRFFIKFHKFPENRRSVKNRNSNFSSSLKLLIVFAYCICINNKIRFFYIFSFLRSKNFCTFRNKLFAHRRNLSVRACNFIAPRQKNFSNRTHSDSADADEMYFLYIFKIYTHNLSFLF